MSDPTFQSLMPPDLNPVLNKLKLEAHRAAYNLLITLNRTATKDKWIQICTSESLTAGLIMSTLVDIPWAGYLKYGCFGVYDTDAKRVFNGVTVDDVYTHRCAKEMAIGILKNSNATVAIAVTGNAMPLNEHAEMLGEVFIGIACYKVVDGKTQIIYTTQSINACLESRDNPDFEGFDDLCRVWFDTIKKEHTYNPRERTALISQEIRYYTVYKALLICNKFIENNKPDVPDFVWARKHSDSEKTTENGSHRHIPPNKFLEEYDEICAAIPGTTVCAKSTGRRVNENTKEYTSSGGRMPHKTQRKNRMVKSLK